MQAVQPVFISTELLIQQVHNHNKNQIFQHSWSLAAKSLEIQSRHPTPSFNGPNETTELEEPIRLYIRQTAFYEKVLKAIPPFGPRGSKPRKATCFWQGPEGGAEQ